MNPEAPITTTMRDRRRLWSRLFWAVGLITTTPVMMVLAGGGVAGFDSLYAFVWGHEILAGRLPLAQPAGAPTPHPLGLVIATLAAVANLPSQPTILALGAVGWATATAAFGLVAAEISQNAASSMRATRHSKATSKADRRRVDLRPPWVAVTAGVTTALLLLASPKIVLLGKTGALDLLFVACVGAALLCMARDRPRLGYALLCVSALERPEGWSMLAATLVIDLKARRVSRRSAALWLLVTPPVWLGAGLLFGDPLAGLRVTTSNAAEFDDPTGLRIALRSLPAGLANGIGAVTLIAALLGALGLAIVIRRGPHSHRPRAETRRGQRPAPPSDLRVLVILFAGIDIAAYLGVGAIGATPIARYLVCAQFLLIALLGGAVGTVYDIVRTRQAMPVVARTAFGIAVAATLILGGVRSVQDYPDLTAVLATQARVNDAMTTIASPTANSETNACPRIRTPTVAQIPIITDATDAPLANVSQLTPTSTGPGSVIYPRNAVAALNAGYGPVLDLDARFAIPPGYQPSRQNDYWALFVSC